MPEQKPEQNQDRTSKEISWMSPEFRDYQKHPLWFVTFALVTALLVMYGIYTKSWTTSLAFLLMGIMGVVYASQKPRLLKVKVSGAGVQLQNLLYNYRIIKKFWIVYNPPEVKTLYLETSAYLNSIVKIELGNQDPTQLRNYLKQYLEEDLDQQESIVDIISRKLKF
jgi:hypothetical protein